MRRLLSALVLGTLLLPRLAAADTLVVLNKAAASATLLDPQTGKKAAADLPTGDGPHEVTQSPDGATAVVANYGGKTPGHSLTVIDIADAKVTKTIDLGDYRRPHGLQWIAGTRVVVVTAEDNQAIVCVNVDTAKIIGSVITGQKASHMLVLTPDGKRAFVANIGSGSVSVIDLAGHRVVATVTTGAGAEGIDITPDGKHVWVTNRGADTVTVLSAATLKPVAELQSKSFPIRAKITPNGRHVLVSNAKSGTVSVFDARTRKLVRTIAMNKRAKAAGGRLFGDRFKKSSVPIGIVTNTAGTRAYVAHAHADEISVVDLSSWKLVGALKAGPEPDGMAYSPVSVAQRLRK